MVSRWHSMHLLLGVSFCLHVVVYTWWFLRMRPMTYLNTVHCRFDSSTESYYNLDKSMLESTKYSVLQDLHVLTAF
jgi:hypothetical protein